MKIAFISILSMLAPLSFASAKSVTIEIANEVSYQGIRTYEDGLTFVAKPQLYSHRLGASTRASAEANMQSFCQKIGMSSVEYRSEYLKDYADTVNYYIDRNGKLSEPAFDQNPFVLEQVICKR